MAADNNSSLMSEICSSTKDLRFESLETIKETYFYSTRERILVTVFYPLLLTFGLTGNLAFLAVVVRIPRMQTITNAYLANLAVADFVIILIQAYDIFIKYLLSPTVEKSPYVTDLGCSAVYGLLYISGCSSILLILFVSIERYSAICRPLKHRAVATKKHTIKMIFLAWSLGVVGAATQVLRLGKVEITCVIWPDATDFINTPSVLTACKPFYPSFKTISLMIQPIPALIISVVSSVMYFKIIRKLHTRKWRKGICKDSHNFNHAGKEERNKVATLLITTGFVFIATCTPFHVLHLNTVILELSNFKVGFNLSPHTYGLLIKMFRGFLVLNSTVNPVIYSVTSPAYRKAFVSLFSSCKRNGHENNSRASTSGLSSISRTEMTFK